MKAKKKRASGSGKRKGGQFERVISVEISKWISGGEREDLIWRSSMSGGRATVAKKKGTQLIAQAGDVSAIHSDAEPFISKFYVECKAYSDLSIPGLITNTGNLVKFWNTTVTEANSYKKHPFLIAKQNRLPIVIFMQGAGLRLLKLSESQSIISSHRMGMYGFLLEEFIKWAKPL